MAPERDIYAVLMDIKTDVGKLHGGQSGLRREVTSIRERMEHDASEGCTLAQSNGKAIHKLDVKVGRIAIAVVVIACAVFGIDKLLTLI